MDASRRAFYEYHAAMMEPWMAGGDRVHRRHAHRRDARPQRPAPGALHHHRRRHGRDGFGSRRAADPESRITKKWRLQPARCS